MGPARRRVVILVAAGVLAAGLGGVAATGAAGAAPAAGQAPALTPNPSLTYNFLEGVSAVSGSDAWAVGNYDNGLSDSLILHWNGTAWSQVNSPNASAYPSDYGLTGVSAVSGTDAWAVGSYGVNGSDTFSTLVLH